MPAKAGIQNYLKTLDSRLRGNDAKGRFKTFYETIKPDCTLINRLPTVSSKRVPENIKQHLVKGVRRNQFFSCSRG